MAGKTPDYWVLLFGIALYTITQPSQMGWPQRMSSVIVSCALAWSFSENLAPYTFNEEKVAMGIIMVGGVGVLDILLTVFRDRDFWRREGKKIARDWVRKKLGLPKDETDA